MSEERIHLQDMAWSDVKAALDAGKRTVLVAVGAQEQHGPQTPLGTDTLLGDYIATQVARRLGDALVAPPINVGSSRAHRNFPGTITYRDTTLMAVLEDYFESLAYAGFEHIAFIQQHGGNSAAMTIVIQDELCYGRKERSAYAYHIVPWTYSPIPSSELFNSVIGYHANSWETAFVLAVRPDLVHMGRAAPVQIELPPLKNKGLHWIVNAKNAMYGTSTGLDSVSPTGAFGDPSKATAEDGKRVLDAIVEGIARELRTIIDEANRRRSR